MISTKLYSIYSAVNDIYDALENKGVTISARKMNQIPQMVASIQGISYPPIIPTDGLSSISAKTNAITQIKNQIKNVIENSGVATTDNLLLFGSYIRQISSGSQHTLVIEGLNVVEGYSVRYSILYDGQSPSGQGVWSVVSGGSYGSINSSTGELTINNTANNSQITIQCIYGGVTATFALTATYQSGKSIDTSTETTTDPDTGETTTTTTTVVINGDGSSTSTSSSTTTDGNGNVTGTSTSNTTTNTDGSSSSTTTNYGVDGNPTTGSNNTVDTSGNSNTQELTYNEDGDPEVTGYTIDTSQNPNGGESVTSLDTGLIALDGDGFIMTMRFKTKFSNNGKKCLFGVLQTGTSANKYSGFDMVITNKSGNGMRLYGGSNVSYSGQNGGYGSVLMSDGYVYPSNYNQITEYTMTFEFYPAGIGPNTHDYSIFIINFSPVTSSSVDIPYTSSQNAAGYIPTSLNEATFVLGGNGVSSTNNMTDLEVLEFTVVKVK